MGWRAIGCECMNVLKLASKGAGDKLFGHYEVLGSLKTRNIELFKKNAPYIMNDYNFYE